MPEKICVVDTTFARVDMASEAIAVLKQLMPDVVVVRRTVPGIKDVAAAMKRLMVEEGCVAGMAFGWVGPSLVDKIAYAAYSMALQMLQLELARHIIDVTVHEDEASDPAELRAIAVDRARRHAENLYYLLRRPDVLEKWAGSGKRQGVPDAGPL